MRVENLHKVEPFITLDGSEIREVAGPAIGSAVNQSLAEATEDTPLKLLCCCAPAYSHEDTVITE